MKPKIDWEKVNENKSMQEKGVENYNYKKPSEDIKRVNCVYCGTSLKTTSKQTEKKHLSNCSHYLRTVKAGRVKDKFGSFKKLHSNKSLKDYLNEPDFPHCLIGKVISTKIVVGKITKVSANGEKITLVTDVGDEKIFLIEILIKQ